MKTVRNRSLIVIILAAVFLFGTGLLMVRLAINAGSWYQKPYNEHILGSGGLEKAGKILDRNGIVLAESVDGVRKYNDDPDIRKSMLHSVGDNSMYISTAVQSIYLSDLTGYSFIWGLGLPDSLKVSRDITLTLDSEACKAAYKALGDRRGAAVVYNYKTGELLCMVSTYTYDPADLPEIDEDNEEEFSGVYLNRALSSVYPPGSTFKLVTAAAAMEKTEDLFDRTFHCEGSKIIGGNKITCLEHHGDISFKNALAKSCNIAFAELAVEIGASKMEETANKMGFNKSYEISGIPTKKTVYDITGADRAELAWSGIGQAKDLANPMQMAVLMGAIANGGSPVIPYFIDTKNSFAGIFTSPKRQGEEMLLPGTAEKLRDTMRYTVESQYGDEMFEGLEVCAKTGTAEVAGKDAHGWITGFSTDSDCPLAFAVIVENGGFGYYSAGPVAVSALSVIHENMRENKGN